ncbi:hypothetical protein [Hymenobacter sp. DG25B]|uniref:hypothetical protein n=1 Tax=Hymenobacter sp. DG25B TaxID=1385664 RepID=UPI0012E084B4|nr:hypothetical protein [Hymenobacter sp. DG25B]
MPKYFLQESFNKLPATRWGELLDKALPKANYLELNQLWSKARLSPVLAQAQVFLPANIPRVYKATHRFSLTPEVVAYIKGVAFHDWKNGAFEDPALYHDNTLLLGTISHEDYVVLPLTEDERAQLNGQGFDIWCEWSLD